MRFLRGPLVAVALLLVPAVANGADWSDWSDTSIPGLQAALQCSSSITASGNLVYEWQFRFRNVSGAALSFRFAPEDVYGPGASGPQRLGWHNYPPGRREAPLSYAGVIHIPSGRPETVRLNWTQHTLGSGEVVSNAADTYTLNAACTSGDPVHVYFDLLTR